MQANSTPVTSNQCGLHPNLQKVLAKRRSHRDQTPIAHHSIEALAEHWDWLDSYQKVILDLGCGSAESTLNLARQYPDSAVLGVDRSALRLRRSAVLPNNARTIHADQYDVIRLFAEHQRSAAQSYLFYPNPSPKSEHLLRRWHAHPAWPLLLEVCEVLELRTNWKIYADEFAYACAFFRRSACVEPLKVAQPISAFERKYQLSGHALWRVRC